LTQHLARQLSDGKVERLEPQIVEAFMHREWPGNVRELRNEVQRVLELGPAGAGTGAPGARPSTSGQAGATPPSGQQYRQARRRNIEEFDRAYLTDLMDRHEGNLSAAAREADISRNYLRELLRKYNLYAHHRD
jgi:DNA-binding NtrC family response regulator